MQERHTVQKDIVYAALCALHNHPTADAVYQEVQRQHPSISRGTVYRVLNAMAEQGKILHLRADGADHYDHRTHRHDHIQCTCCGRVDDVVTRGLDDVTAAVTDSCGYLISDASLLFRGICQACQTKHESAI